MNEMNDCLPIMKATIGSESVNSVNARQLHASLGVSKDFSDWMKSQIDRAGLVENEDFGLLPQKGENPKVGRPAIEYALTLDAAKHVAMLSATEAGRQVRRYFIEAEKALRQPTAILTKSDLARMVIESEAELEKARALIAENAVALSEARTEIVTLKPDANYARAVLMASNCLTSTEVAKRLGLSSAIALHAEAKRLGLIFQSSGTWVPYSKWSEKDRWFSARVHQHSTNTRGLQTKQQLVWTEEGVQLIARMLGIIETQLAEVRK